ncbi:WD40-repeat-containing domain protein [Xylaria intraflava]|nr:WD40-repeat-containing domain protein [Xylaria intraflava]
MSHEVTPPGQLRREYVLSPITALAFVTFGEGRYLLAAEDTHIKVYDVATSRLNGSIRVFDAQPIHGVYVTPATEENGSPSTLQILVWGGRAVKLLPGRALEALVGASSINSDDATHFDSYELAPTDAALFAPGTVAPDWILDGRISPFEEGRIVLLTAHNEVIQGRVSADQKTIILGRVQSPSRPILYSGNFFWAARDCVLVAAGTVFGEIVVWKCHLSPNLDDDSYDDDTAAGDAQGRKDKITCEVLFVFSGHQGSIFGIHISPEFRTETGETVRLLASCSDDRTIRIWDITEQRDDSGNEEKGYESQISDARQTGFGDSITGSVGLVSNRSRCIAMAMGHISRIWRVQIQTNPFLSKGVIEVYSFGEDATMQIWNLELGSLNMASDIPKTSVSNGSDHPLAKLTHSETFSNHSGKHIWSHAIISSMDGLLIATGGGDGKIALMNNGSVHSLPMPDDSIVKNGRHSRSVQELDVSPLYLIERCQNQGPSAVTPISTYKHGNGKEMFQSFAFVTDSTLLITTRSGRLFLGSFGSKIEWEELVISDAIRTAIQSYTILRSSRRASTSFIGAPNGELFYYHKASGDSLRSIHKAERKIIEIICLSDNQDSSSHMGHDSDGLYDGHIEILVMVFGSRKAELLRIDRAPSVTQRTEVTVPPEFIVTAAAWCQNYLILGSRNGNLSIFDLATNGGESPLLTMEVNVGDKITSILPLPRRSEDSPPYFLTTARDGKYRIYEIINTTSSFQVPLLHEIKPPFGPLIEGSWLFDKADWKQDLMLCGFQGKDFVVWNATQQNEVATFDCGGGHRVFDHAQIRGNPAGFRFVCTKASQMKIFSQTRAPHFPLKTGGHGREIKAVSASRKYVATGAEDTVIRIWELCRTGRDKREQQLRCVLALEKHNTGIQKLKWHGDQYLFSSGGNEEFFAWRITALESDVFPLGVVCEAVFPDRSEVGDLRITDFDVHCVNEHVNAGEEYKDTGSGVEKSRAGPTFCISMTLSNSAVQSYLYSAQAGFRLLGRRMYTGACLTQIRHLGFTNGCYPQVLTAATDGHLAIFSDVRSPQDGTEDSMGVTATKLHQSTVKSLDMQSIATETGTSYLVVTGGDDNAIGVLHLSSVSLDSSTKSTSWQLVNTDLGAASSSTSQPLPSSQGPKTLREYEIRNKSIVRAAHAAAVTGLGIVRLENEGRDAVIVTASNDQRVKTWRLVDWQSSSLRVHLIDDRYSGVADAGDLEVVREWNGGREGGRDGEVALVAGVGVEAWSVA